VDIIQDGFANDMRSGVYNVDESGTRELNSFMADVEDLVERVASMRGADVERARAELLGR
jgi:hypothetical protein